jgi:flagellar motor component MotA
MNFKKKLINIFVILYCVQISFAYIDPGTATAVAGSIWPLLLVFLAFIGGFFVKYFIKPIKLLFMKNKKDKKDEKE